ncbi:hypothetical protein [Bilophila wadsworthia]|uniref:hypothetical protein n=1 Tax=Bilophila wadsworthia TaxID=35833 RepID=UPI002666104A|nr:hypothetical protein [Bilophila wadsworthia]
MCKWHGGNSKGAPKGNKNALKHGAYESISLETMFPDEIEYANSISLDPLTTLHEQLRVWRVKEARLAKRMKKALEAEMNAGKDDGTGKKGGQMVVITATQTQAENYQGEKSKTVTTNSETHSMQYLRLEQAHSIVLDEIRRVLEAIVKVESLKGEGTELPASIEVHVVNGRRTE